MTDLAYFTMVSDDSGWTSPQQAVARARQSAEEMHREGRRVRFLRAVYVPEDDRWFLLYEAPTPEAVREAMDRAALSSAGSIPTLTAIDREALT